MFDLAQTLKIDVIRGEFKIKKFILVLACFILTFSTACGEQVEEGTLYTREDIFIDCIKIDYPAGFTSKMMAIENEEQLGSALENYAKLKEMPRFEEIMTNYPIDKNVYVIQFVETDYASETVSCDGIRLDKENETIRFQLHTSKKKSDTFGVVAGYITYAVFPKEEVAGFDFQNRSM